MHHAHSKDGDIVEWTFFGNLRWKEIVIHLHGPDLEVVPRRTARCPGRPPDRRRHPEQRSFKHYSKSDASNSSSQIWDFRPSGGYTLFVLYTSKFRHHTGSYNCNLYYTGFVSEQISPLLFTHLDVVIVEGSGLAKSVLWLGYWLDDRRIWASFPPAARINLFFTVSGSGAPI